ncbi:MAG: hypothetical protein QRY71_00515 [Candidatus Rhabdochlamydia sp.]
MPFIHVANTDAEREMEGSSHPVFQESLNSTPITRQLQFLPLLYKKREDQVLVTSRVEKYKDHLQSFIGPFKEGSEILSWAPSLALASFAKQNGLIYLMPEWEVVKEVNSKAFSFHQGTYLPRSELITSWDQLVKWISLTEGPRVLKTCFGSAGKGHLLLPGPSLQKLEAFAYPQFLAGRPLIAEPFVKRVLDFSTQWIISKDQTIHYVGSTVLQNSPKGHYQASVIGEESLLFKSYLPQLDSHKITAESVLKKMASLGFFGHVGIDAMIWGEAILHPIVEINARKTMGFMALEMRKQLFPHQTIKLSYTHHHRSGLPLLPQEALFNGRNDSFPYNLYAEILQRAT